MNDLGFLERTRASYDAMVTGYVERFAGRLSEHPVERSQLALFAELALAGPVADVGCGPGDLTAFLHDLGLDVTGVDLSPAMIAHARATHPGIAFQVGTMTALEFPDESLAGLNAWYSTIHVPDEHLPEVFDGFHRVLRPGAPVMLAFQIGDEPKHYDEAWGVEVDVTFHRRHPEAVAALLTKAGFAMTLTTVQEPGPGQRLPAACLIAHKPIPAPA